MSVKIIPEKYTITCDNCGLVKELKSRTSVPTYWALVQITRHEDWAGGTQSNHYCDKCYDAMKITFGGKK